MTAIEVKEDFERLHNVVREGLNTYKRVGFALQEINERALYKLKGYDDFQSYAREEFEFSRAYAYRLIEAADLGTKFDLPNERVARAVKKVPEELRQEVVDKAKSRQADLTHSIIEDMHEEVVRQTAPQVEVLDTPPGAAEFEEIQQLIAELGKKMAALSKSPAGTFMPMTHLNADLKNVWGGIKLSVPTHKCYLCSGEGCDICNGLGWVTQDMWDRRPIEFE